MKHDDPRRRAQAQSGERRPQYAGQPRGEAQPQRDARAQAKAPRPARRTYDIPPATRIDGPTQTLPGRPGTAPGARTLPGRPGTASGARTLPGRPQGERPAEAFAGAPRPAHAREEGISQPPENLLVGRNPIREALKSGVPLEKLLVASGDLSGAAQAIVRMAREAGVVVQTVERRRLDQIYPAHQGMLAFRSAREYASIEQILDCARQRGEAPLVVVLDQLTDPHNLGAIIRTCECAGAHGVILPQRRSAGLTPACEKAAAGALSHVRVARVKNLNRALEDLKKAGLWIVAAALEGEDALTADLSGPVALVIGSEGEGVSRLTLSLCDRRVTLPMLGKIESLNASVAAGVLLYQVVRARRSGQ